MPAIDKDLLAILICPESRQPLREAREIVGGGGPGRALVVRIFLLREHFDARAKQPRQRRRVGGEEGAQGDGHGARPTSNVMPALVAGIHASVRSASGRKDAALCPKQSEAARRGCPGQARP